MKENIKYINKVIQGDCLEVMLNISNKSIDMILCDLPYGTTACKWDTVIPFEPLWKEYKRIIKDNGAVVLFGNQPFTSIAIVSNLEMFKYCWVWNKVRLSGFQIAKYRPMMQHEDICVFSKGKLKYYPQMIESKKRISWCVNKSESSPLKYNDGIKRQYNEYYPKSILKFTKPNPKEYLHPTQKPVALFEYLIKTYTNKGDLVLDNCAGSGTTGVACKNLNRNFILIEKEKKYCDIAIKRINETPARLFY